MLPETATLTRPKGKKTNIICAFTTYQALYARCFINISNLIFKTTLGSRVYYPMPQVAEQRLNMRSSWPKQMLFLLQQIAFHQERVGWNFLIQRGHGNKHLNYGAARGLLWQLADGGGRWRSCRRIAQALLRGQKGALMGHMHHAVACYRDKKPAMGTRDSRMSPPETVHTLWAQKYTLRSTHRMKLKHRHDGSAVTRADIPVILGAG